MQRCLWHPGRHKHHTLLPCSTFSSCQPREWDWACEMNPGVMVIGISKCRCRVLTALLKAGGLYPPLLSGWIIWYTSVLRCIVTSLQYKASFISCHATGVDSIGNSQSNKYYACLATKGFCNWEKAVMLTWSQQSSKRVPSCGKFQMPSSLKYLLKMMDTVLCVSAIKPTEVIIVFHSFFFFFN